METLAYTHLAIAHEETAYLEPEAYELKLFNRLNWKLPSAAWIGLIASVMALSVFSLASSALAAVVKTNGGPLNVRSSPGGTIVGSLPNGANISLSGRTSGDWSQLSNGNWVSSGFVSGGGSSNNGGVPSDTLQRGSSGSAVTNLQNRLKALGFYKGPITGTFDNLTEVAVKDFQRSRKIQQTGIVGPQTRSALYGNASVPSRGKQAVVNTAYGSLNVRSSPGGSVISKAPKGSYVYLTGRKSGNWVELKGGGWVYETYLRSTGQIV